MSLVSIIVKEGLENLGRFYSSYRGIVIDNKDPKNMGRLSVVVPQVSSRAIWATPKGLDGALQSGFKWLTPTEGQVVWVEYQLGDPSYPLWSYHAWANNEIPDDLKKTSNLGFVTPRGNKVIIEDVESHLYLHIVDSDSGNIVANIDISKGKLTIETEEEIYLKSEAILLNGDSEGVPMSSKLVTRLNTIEDDINTLKTIFNTWAPVSEAALKAAMAAWFTSLTPTIESDIQNDKVKQS